MKVSINNLDEDHERFVVCRLVESELWYWGSWSDPLEAERVARTFENGVVVDTEVAKM